MGATNAKLSWTSVLCSGATAKHLLISTRARLDKTGRGTACAGPVTGTSAILAESHLVRTPVAGLAPRPGQGRRACQTGGDQAASRLSPAGWSWSENAGYHWRKVAASSRFSVRVRT